MTYEKNTLCVRVINKKKAAATFNKCSPFHQARQKLSLENFTEVVNNLCHYNYSSWSMLVSVFQCDIPVFFKQIWDVCSSDNNSYTLDTLAHHRAQFFRLISTNMYSLT